MLTLGGIPARSLASLRRWLAAHDLHLEWCPAGRALPGSFWGAPEAGIVGRRLYVSERTPLHSLLHEACHVICAQAAGRAAFENDAGGSELEEAAVCALQLLTASRLTGIGWRRLARDMDAWGYSFRAGSTAAWWCTDADDARDWLLRHALTAAEVDAA